MKKVNSDIKSLYDQTVGERRAQLLYDRLLKEINDEYKFEFELISSRQALELSVQEHEKFKQDFLYEKSGKQKLETYCTDLRNRHNQIIEDANKLSDDERQKRLEISTHFQNELTQQSRKLDEACHHRAEYTKYNEMLKEKMKELLGFVEERDKTFAAMLEEKSKELEEYKAKAEVKPNPEEDCLRGELEEYKKKFEDFQNSLTESNQHFSTFKKDMDTKAKMLKKVQIDNLDLKKREGESMSTLKELREEVGRMENVKAKITNDIIKLNDLKNRLAPSN